jgi:hypothetical protein
MGFFNGALLLAANNLRPHRMFSPFSFDAMARMIRDSPRLSGFRQWLRQPPDSEEMRRLRSAWFIAAAALLAWGAWVRFRLPLEPIVDADIEGYLGPALSALSGHHFVHVLGRSFPYPGFVFLVLRLFGDFRAIAIVQHLLGVAAGAVILLAWNAVGRLVPPGGFPKPLYPFLGLAPAWTYLESDAMIVFEHHIRPEAVFPFFCILTLWVGILFMEARFVRKQPRAIWLGALNVFLACLLYETKPSFGIAVLFCTLPVWISLFAPGAGIAARIGLLAAAILPSLFLLALPEHLLSRDDTLGKMFLPETLFTIHAKIIERQMAADLAGSGPLPYPREFLQGADDLLKREIDIATHSGTTRKYVTLGTNPDYLMYRDSFCSKFLRASHFSREQMTRFYFTWYLRALTHQPGAMLMKIVRQFGVVYRPKCPIFWSAQRTNLSGLYASAGTLLQHTEHLGPGLPVVARYIAGCDRLGQRRLWLRESPPFVVWVRTLAILYTPLLIFALASPFYLFRKPLLRTHFFWLVAALWLACGFGLGNSLTIAVVHSLEVGRYTHIQLIFAMFAELLTVYLLVELAAFRAGEARK